jgi:hypothetical protein
LAHPGGNIPGFVNFERSIGGKWLAFQPTSTTGENQAIPVLSAALIAAVHESAFGTKQISRKAQPMSAFEGKADIE